MYSKTDQLWVITTYYNPCRFKSRRRNFELFERSMLEAGIPLTVIECTFDRQAPELPAKPHIIHMQADAVLWQKERLLNLAASWVPMSCKNIAWLDCDVLFDDPNWAVNAVDALRRHRVVQLFTTADRLDKHGKTVGDIVTSFAAVTAPDPQVAFSHHRYDAHGHTGYGWAMNRDIFDKLGLYEHAISGSADHFMAHAIYGNCNHCVVNALKHDPMQVRHLLEWSERFHDLVRGGLGIVPGNIRHLWHGELADRRYFKRMHDITDLGFDPYADIQATPGAPLSWKRPRPMLEQYFRDYFQSRREDGQAFA